MYSISTILADDHKLFCDGVEHILSSSGRFNVVGKISNGADVLRDWHRLDAELLLLDIEMPGLNGLEVLQRIRFLNSTLKIVMLSLHGEPVFSQESQRLGADGYLLKSIDGTRLVDFLLKVVRGEMHFVPGQVAQEKQNGLVSKRELEILKLIAAGKTSDQIGRELKVSNFTVKAHRRNMMRKFHTDTSASLISQAFAKGII